MISVASAPGKAVLLGEYVVLDGALALVMAVDRRATAVLARASGRRCRFETLAPSPKVFEFPAGEAMEAATRPPGPPGSPRPSGSPGPPGSPRPSGSPGPPGSPRPTGSALVDSLLADFALPWPAWSAKLDSSAFFAGGSKLGLGSSAAALVAFAGAAWHAGGKAGHPPLQALIDCHRAFQGGVGSGIDVAASLHGGLVSFRLDQGRNARVGSVRLPKSVGFAGIFAGGAASTPDLVGQYRRWSDTGRARSAALRERLIAVAERGCAAADEDDGPKFVGAIDEYGHCLEELGRAMGADLVTAAHRKIGALAGEMGLAYKVSGAGGGDIGIACGIDGEALQSFAGKAADQGFHVVPLTVDELGLRVNEEHAE